MNIISFNTNRPYRDNGQIITAVEHDGTVYMIDWSRGLEYHYDYCILSQSAIMHHYDNNLHSHDRLPVCFLEMRGEMERHSKAI